MLVGSERYLDAAIKAARPLARAQRADGWLAGTYDGAWQPGASYCCLTGVAQMSLNWIRWGHVARSDELSDAARRGLSYLKRRQRVADRDDVARGAIAGSSPIWGAYSRFEFPNWATKFFADALMMDRSGRAIPPVAVGSRTSDETVAHV